MTSDSTSSLNAFWENWPQILAESAISNLGIIALVLLGLSLIALNLAPTLLALGIRLLFFLGFFIGFIVLGLMAIDQTTEKLIAPPADQGEAIFDTSKTCPTEPLEAWLKCLKQRSKP